MCIAANRDHVMASKTQSSFSTLMYCFLPFLATMYKADTPDAAPSNSCRGSTHKHPFCSKLPSERSATTRCSTTGIVARPQLPADKLSNVITVPQASTKNMASDDTDVLRRTEA